MENAELREHLRKLEKRIIVVYLIGLVAILGLATVANYLMKYQEARQTSSLIHRAAARDPREALYTLDEAELNFFNGIVYFDQDGEKIFSVPADLDPDLAAKPSFAQNLIYSRIKIDLFFDPTEKVRVGSVLFLFNRFSYGLWAFLIWGSFLLGTIPLIRLSRIRLTENYKRDVALREESTRAELARRVRHDIGSPLGALLIATEDLLNLDDQKRSMIKTGLQRIQEIVSELELIRVRPNQTTNPKFTERRSQAIAPIIQDIVQEKKIRLAFSRAIAVSFESLGDAQLLYSNVRASELKRALSNILENAIEACTDRGRILVSVKKIGGDAVIAIQDDGRGIPKKMLSMVTQKGFTFGKPNSGDGLGLFYAKNTIEEVGGKLEIESDEGVGTVVSIHLPLAASPAWYRTIIDVPQNGCVVILDDQKSSHLSLRVRLEEIRSNGAKFELTTFFKPTDFVRWLEASPGAATRSDVLFLLDYDLGKGEKTGLQIANENGLSSNTILVTANADSDEIQRQCEAQKLGLVAKQQISSIEFRAV